jgi:uncharacterized protein YdaU (DUF1376 family)
MDTKDKARSQAGQEDIRTWAAQANNSTARNSGAKTNWFLKLWLADFLSATNGMTPEEVGAYTRLIVQYRLQEAPLADDEKLLARIVGLTPFKWRRVCPVVQKAFVIADGIWREPAIDQQIIHAREMHRQACEAGKASAAARLRRVK